MIKQELLAPVFLLLFVGWSISFVESPIYGDYPMPIKLRKMGYPKTIKMIRDPDFFYTGQKNQGYF
ncbi:hypothetical protein COJ77_10485 [Bacillus cereus]|nr:hypothetical protein COJ77_10485 [Bacillus cereus]